MTARQLKDLYDRKAGAMGRRSDFARGSGHAHVTLRAAEGFVAEVIHGDRSQRVDLPIDEGGTATGPHPGQLMRASIGACLAMGYRLWAARLEVVIEAVSLDIHCEYDARGQMGVDAGVAVGWQHVLVDVTVTSAAPEEDVRRVVEAANRHSPMLANLARDIRQTHRLTIIRPWVG